MEYQEACKDGYEFWAYRLSGNNLIVSINGNKTHIYTDEEVFEIKDYDLEDVDDWIPLPKCPDYLPKTTYQNHKFFKDKYRKLRKEELDNKINKLEEDIK